jgi:hypothetical protein
MGWGGGKAPIQLDPLDSASLDPWVTMGNVQSNYDVYGNTPLPKTFRLILFVILNFTTKNYGHVSSFMA